MQFLNAYTEDHRDICEQLRLKEILWAAKLIPNKGTVPRCFFYNLIHNYRRLIRYQIIGLLKFQKAGDQDGFIGDFSAKTKLTTETYQLKVKTEPGDGLFEVSITYDIRRNAFSTKVSSRLISANFHRMNMKVSKNMYRISDFRRQ